MVLRNVIEIDIEYALWNDDAYCDEHDVEQVKWKCWCVIWWKEDVEYVWNVCDDSING